MSESNASPELLEQIGRALGQPGPYREALPEREDCIALGAMWQPPAASGNYSLKVLAGCSDPSSDRAAWIEEEIQAHTPGGGVPVEIYLKIAGDGELLLSRPIESYNPYFGCRVGAIQFFGDRVVVVYSEKHKTLAWSVPLDEDELPRLLSLRGSAVIIGDVLYLESKTPGLIESRELPSLEACIPLPCKMPEQGYLGLEAEGDQIIVSAHNYKDGEHTERELERLRAPTAEQRVFPVDPDGARAAIAASIFGEPAPQPSADILLYTGSEPFWSFTEPGVSYPGAGGHRLSFQWFPVYWYQHLKDKEPAQAQLFLKLLESLAADAGESWGWEPGWSSEEGLRELLTRHVQNCAGMWARVCREGRLPDRQYCYLWRHLLPGEFEHFPDSVQGAINKVWAQMPRSLSEQN